MKKVNLPEPAPSSTTYRGSDASMGNFASECIQSRKKLKRTLAYAPTCDQVFDAAD